MTDEFKISNTKLPILIVSASPTERVHLRHSLSMLKLNTSEETRSGEEALELLKSSAVALVLCEQHLPDTSGLKLLRAVRSLPECARLPFIIMAQPAERNEFINAVELGVTDYIVKPFTLDTLEQRIHAALTRKLTLFVEWSPKFSVGDPKLDEQHQRLLQLINQLHESITLGRSRELTRWVLDELVNYTDTHFKDEEEVMSAHNYPGLKGHREAHARLTQEVVDLQAKSSDALGLSVEVMLFLKRWLTDHILESDKRYAPFLKIRPS